MREVVILGAARTIGGQFGGSFQNLTAPELGATVVRESIKRSGITPEVIDQTVFGNAWQAGVGPNAARLSSVMGGVPVEAPAVTVNVRCGSSSSEQQRRQAGRGEDLARARNVARHLRPRSH